jgi:hypothetical protein
MIRDFVVGSIDRLPINASSQHNYAGIMLYPVTLAKTKLIESGISRFDVNQGASLRD